MQFSLEEFAEKIAIPYLLEIEDDDERKTLLRNWNQQRKSSADRQRMVDQTDNAFAFPLDEQMVL